MTGAGRVNAAADNVHAVYEHADILELLPHRGSMLLLRRLTVHARNTFTGEALWTEGEPFIGGWLASAVPATLLVEAAAQAAGAGLLAVAPPSSNRAEGLGMLAGLRRCEFHVPVRTGQIIQFRAKTRLLGPTLAHAHIDVVQFEEVAAQLQLLLALRG